MNDTGNITQYSQEDVDEKVSVATTLEEDAERREDDGEDDFADVATVTATLVVTLNPHQHEFESSGDNCSGAKRNERPSALSQMGELETCLAVNAMLNQLIS